MTVKFRSVADKAKLDLDREMASVSPDLFYAQKLAESYNKEVAFSISSNNHTEASRGGGEGVNDPNSMRQKSLMARLRERALPASKHKRIQRSIEWHERDDLLERLIGVKIDFATIGFNLQCKPEEGIGLERLLKDSTGNPETNGSAKKPTEPATGDDILSRLSDQDRKELIQQAKFQKTLNLIQQKWELKDLCEQLMQDWYVTDSMILYWRVDDAVADSSGKSGAETDAPPPRSKESAIPGLVDLNALSPGDVDWDNSFGQDKLQVFIPKDLLDRVAKALMGKKGMEKAAVMQELVDSGIPAKWILAIANGSDKVELSRDDGDNWLIKTKNRKHHGLAKPTMFTIFLDLEIRRALKEGEHSASWMMKHFIFQVKAGESIQQGPMAGQRNNWAKKPDTDALFNMVKDPVAALVMATNHTVGFEFVHPPVEMFSGDKYVKAEESIYNWAGVTIVVFTGEGGTYGSGFIGIKRMTADMQSTRSKVNWLFQEFFDHPTIRDRISTPKNCLVNLTFNENVLKEPAQLLNELKFLVENSFGDPRSALQELGRDPDAMTRSKMTSMLEDQRTGVYSWPAPPDPFASRNEQREQPNAGRPRNEDSPPANEGSRTQEPVSGR